MTSLTVEQVKMYKKHAEKEIIEIIERCEKYTECRVTYIHMNDTCGRGRNISLNIQV